MHVSVQCWPELFTAQRSGHPCTLQEVLPRWALWDRIGVVVDEPMGAVGASAMIQSAVALFYAALPSRRRDQYPPLFLFHVGGHHGDFSPMDVWPPRREVFLPADAYEVLGAVRDRAITRLLVPDRPAVSADDQDWVREAPSGWTDAASFREQLASAYAYSPGGSAEGADTWVRTDDADCESMVEDVLDPQRLHKQFNDADDETLLAMGAGPSSVRDLRLWLEIFGQRLDEVDASTRAALLERRHSQRDGTRITQGYRTLTVDQTLTAIGAVAENCDTRMKHAA
ncbi:hypothetical protein [Nesterenkonia muleiensis]|uniref:hypothetical protein n=1 Tax=Nesterenkonia muleiensis TaxID=2282648 RepID=UPI000E707F46|nr:hypothetical protein [Nesterenkonia muleiensis]